MSDIRNIKVPLTAEDAKGLKAGERVTISGVIYTARDAAHAKLLNALNNGESLPLEIEGGVIYYVGPCPAKKGQVIGSCGPTTSYRMDSFAPTLIEKGLKGMIGKGPRDEKVINAMKENNAVYFAAIGGAAALIANSVKKAEVIAYPELGTEAVRRLEVEDFPCIVAIDSEGNNLYESGVEKYRQL
ncbi:MAG: Fe-S-containing hydro-lyase [Clostridia bacterium]|nr:Fe-S-containing hydro-lyase [Clostridia bacterium]